MIHNYAGQNASASVWASSDNVDFVEVGQLGGGTPGYFTDDWIDFDGLVCDVHYVRVMREAVGSKTAAFIDAFGAPLPSVDPGVGVAVGPFPCVDAMPAPPPPPLPIPEPGTVALLGLGSLAFARRRW